MILHLVPFGASLYFYFYELIPYDNPSVYAAFVKCLPIWCLAGAAYLYGRTLSTKIVKTNYHTYVAIGLAICSIGDACLIWHEHFVHGMLAFGIGHCFYIYAFGFQPLGLSIGVVLYALSAIVLVTILPHIDNPEIFFGMPVYSFLLVTMAWRTLVQAFSGPEAWQGHKLIAALGAVLFLISDTLVSVHDLQFPIPNGQVYIMGTYYAAQLFITLSVCNRGKGGNNNAANGALSSQKKSKKIKKSKQRSNSTSSSSTSH